MSLDEGRKVRVRKIGSFGKIVVLPTFILALILPTTAALAEEAGPVPTAGRR